MNTSAVCRFYDVVGVPNPSYARQVIGRARVAELVSLLAGNPALSGIGGTEKALDAAEADLVSDCEFEGGGPGAVCTPHRFDHVVGESFAEAPRCHAGRFSIWPPVP